MNILAFSLLRKSLQCLSSRIAKCNVSSSGIGVQRNSSKKIKICVIGAGPAGFYAAQYMLKHLIDCEVDVIERLPVPFGLVRYGVAPDHPEVKNVINTFNKTAENPRFRFLGNLCLGVDFTLRELREYYHAVLLAYGADKDRRLNIPNENQSNVISAREFVAWYNGLPGAEKLNPDLSGKTVTIVGQGNVAVDVARILLSPLDVLRSTDTTEYALDGLSRSQVERVLLVGRRGPLQAAFTIKELREILRMPNVQTIWKAADFEGIHEQVKNLERPRKRLTELMLKSLSEQRHHEEQGKKQFLPIFLRAPTEIENNFMKFTVTHVENNIATPTDRTEKLAADLILRSIGYQSRCVDPDICFNEQYGHVFNKNGRVLLNDETRDIDRGLYVTGWLGSGPTGVILTTMNGAFLVAKSICDDILTNKIDTTQTKSGLPMQNKRVVSWNGWKRIDEAEVEAGKAKGKPREKIVDVEKMLSIAGV